MACTQNDSATDYYGAPSDVYSPGSPSRHIEPAARQPDYRPYQPPPQQHAPQWQQYQQPPQQQSYQPPPQQQQQQQQQQQPQQPLQPYGRPSAQYMHSAAQGAGARSGFVSPTYGAGRPQPSYVGSRSMTHSGAATPTFVGRYGGGGGTVPYGQWGAQDAARNSYQGDPRQQAPQQQQQQQQQQQRGSGGQDVYQQHQQLVEQHKAVEVDSC